MRHFICKEDKSMKNNQKLVVFSADAMVAEDMELMRTLPNFSRYFAEASGVEQVRSIYPSVTYPAHATIASGLYPCHHGIVNNEVLCPGRTASPWNWFHEAVRGDDIFSAAKRAGLSTAAVFWPVTGNHPDIDYLVDEYWPQGPEDSAQQAFLRAGTSKELLETVVNPLLEGVEIRKHPSTDQFVVDCAAEIIRRYQPDLLMIHPANVDAYRHETGLFTDKVAQGVRETDRWLGQLIQATKDAGVFEQTNFVLLSDHGQMDIRRVVNLNVFFRDEGLIQTDEAGNVTDYQVWSHSAALSSQIYLKHPEDAALRNRVHRLLLRWADEGIYGISKVFTAQEILEREHVSGDFSFMVESDGFTSLGNGWMRPIVTPLDNSNYRLGRATHGHLPDKGPQPIFWAMGPAVQPSVVLKRRPLVDEAPTFARMLGIDYGPCDGCAMDELLK